MKLTLDRSEVCRLLIICTQLAQYFYRNNDAEGAEMWNKLHDKIKKQLDEFDKKNQ